jgi:transposase InsO family protein
MPWEEYTVEQNRLNFVLESIEKELSFSALCRKYNITRKTGQKWLDRYLNGEDLSNRSNTPFHMPNKTSTDIEMLILNARKSHDTWGSRKLKKYLENKGYSNLPAHSTISDILKRNNCISKSESLKHLPYTKFERDLPNELWQTDFKGDFLMSNGKRCFPLTVLDDNSRYSLCIDAKDNQKSEGVFGSFERLFKTYGLPNAILCDNGNPWGCSQRTGYTKFEVWLMKLDIQPIHGRILHPQTQ